MNGADRFFVDTNILLYAADPANPHKQKAAHQWLDALWEQAAGRLSWQVLHEFYVNAIRKLKTPPKNARLTVETFVEWQPVDTSVLLIQRAWQWMDTAHLPYWDSLIIAAAERSECTWLLSEDFQAGRRFGSVAVINPFRARPDEHGLDASRGA